VKSNSFSQLVSIVLLFLILVCSVVFVLPMRKKVEELRASRDLRVTEVEALEGDYTELKALSEEVVKSESTREALKTAVPVGYDQDALLLELSELAKDLGFALNAVNFSDSVSQDYGKTIGISANFTGTYEDLVGFLQKLEGADRLLRVTNMSVQRVSSADISFSVNIEAYYQ
jgi:Tfp pilus assembly protein PilO